MGELRWPLYLLLLCHLLYNIISLRPGSWGCCLTASCFVVTLCIVLTALLTLRSDLLLVSTKGIFPGRNDSEADAPILWPPDVLTHWKRPWFRLEEKGWKRMRCLDSITESMDMNLSKLREMVRDGKPAGLQSMGSQRVRRDLVTEQQQHTHIFV